MVAQRAKISEPSTIKSFNWLKLWSYLIVMPVLVLLINQVLGGLYVPSMNLVTGERADMVVNHQLFAQDIKSKPKALIIGDADFISNFDDTDGVKVTVPSISGPAFTNLIKLRFMFKLKPENVFIQFSPKAYKVGEKYEYTPQNLTIWNNQIEEGQKFYSLAKSRQFFELFEDISFKSKSRSYTRKQVYSAQDIRQVKILLKTLSRTSEIHWVVANSDRTLSGKPVLGFEGQAITVVEAVSLMKVEQE